MKSNIASEERANFSDRLKSSLIAADVSLRASHLAREFSLRADGAAVTQHAVRKWLIGEAIPTHERIVILAHWLGVQAGWLRFGDAANGQMETALLLESQLSSDELRLMRDVASLSLASRMVVRDLVDSLMTNYPAVKSAQAAGS